MGAEPLKRQRRWNSPNTKALELQASTQAQVTTPKDTSQPPSRNFSRSNSTASDDTPKDRVGELYSIPSFLNEVFY